MNDMAMNQLWATQQSKLEEKDAEIERLKEQLKLAQVDNNQLEISALERDAEIERLRLALETEKNRNLEELKAAIDKHLPDTLKALCARAADALESNQMATSTSCEIFTLIDELRKEAQ